MCVSFSRYTLGAHALNQIVFGILIGIWEALTLHFIVRETLIVHMGQVMKIERSYIHAQNRLLSMMSVGDNLLKSQTLDSNHILPQINGGLDDGRKSSSNSSGDLEQVDTLQKRDEEKKVSSLYKKGGQASGLSNAEQLQLFQFDDNNTLGQKFNNNFGSGNNLMIMQINENLSTFKQLPYFILACVFFALFEVISYLLYERMIAYFNTD